MRKITQLLSILLCFVLLFEQSGFAQVETQNFASLHLSARLSASHNTLTPDNYRPLHLRYLGYDTKSNDFKLLLDKGDFVKEVDSRQKTVGSERNSLQATNYSLLTQETNKLMEYFFIGLTQLRQRFSFGG